MSSSIVVKYYSTAGFTASIPGSKTKKLVRIAADKLRDGAYKVYVESGHTLARLRQFPVITISNEDARELFDDDNVQEFRNFSELFGITLSDS